MSDESASGAEQKPERPSLVSRIRALFGIDEQSVREGLEEALDESSADAELSAHERTMLRNVLRLHDVRVKDVMIPRADIVGVSIERTLGEVLALFRAAEHSRLPVYGETLDDPRGMIHIRDFVDYLAEASTTNGKKETPPRGFGDIDFSATLGSISKIRPVLFVPGSMPALDLLVKMQSSRTHMALVIDEYGGTDGLASLEDIVEVIVGDIGDEHDEAPPPPIAAAPDGSFTVDARTPLGDIQFALGHSFEAAEEADEIETIGGLVAVVAGRVPARNEIIKLDEAIECRVLDADPRRLKKLLLRRRSPIASGLDSRERA